MKMFKIITYIWIGFIIIMFAAFLILIMGVLVDTFTIKEVGTEQVPCIDKLGRPFESELCEKTITCSWLGLTSNERCKYALSGEKE